MDSSIQHIIKSALEGDRKAQRQLFDKHLPYVAGLCRRYVDESHLVPDAIQESFIAVFKSLENYNPNLGCFKAWLRQVTINTCLQITRSNKRHINHKVFKESTQATHIQIEAFNKAEILSLIKSIPEKYRVVFNLFVVDGYSHKEIAKFLNISIEQSRQQLSRARKWIKSNYLLQGNEIVVQLKANKI